MRGRFLAAVGCIRITGNAVHGSVELVFFFPPPYKRVPVLPHGESTNRAKCAAIWGPVFCLALAERSVVTPARGQGTRLRVKLTPHAAQKAEVFLSCPVSVRPDRKPPPRPEPSLSRSY